MYKIIACDLDETLISEDGTISKKNIEAINRATEAGVKFVLATGRGYKTVIHTLKTLSLFNKSDEYVISFNGGAITENKGDRLLYFKSLPFKEAEELYQIGLENNLCMHVYTKEEVYVYNFNESEQGFLRVRMKVTPIDNRNLDFLKGQDIVKVLYMNTDFDYLNKLLNEMGPLVKDMDVSFSSNRYMEFNAKGVTKGDGLKSLCKLLNVDIKDTIAIGDNFNDLSMIKAAGLGVGVKNSNDGIKAFCKYITKNDNNHDAIYEVINKFIFGE